MDIDKYELYIFDMDGLIFDTEILYVNLFPKILEKEGYILDKEKIQATIGMNSKSCKEYFLKLFPLLDFEKAEEKLDEELLNISRNNELKFMPGAFEFIKYLNENKKLISLASSSNRYKIEEFLKNAEILNYFDYIISGEEVKKGKPDPEIFNKVIEKFDIPLDKVVIFEDSINGVIAGAKTGAKVIMIPNLIKPDERLKGLDHLVYNNFYEILNKKA